MPLTGAGDRIVLPFWKASSDLAVTITVTPPPCCFHSQLELVGPLTEGPTAIVAPTTDPTSAGVRSLQAPGDAARAEGVASGPATAKAIIIERCEGFMVPPDAKGLDASRPGLRVRLSEVRSHTMIVGQKRTRPR